MKQCILVGGGSKFGALLTKQFLEQDYTVHLITSNGSAWQHNTQVNVIDVDWHNLDITKLKFLIPDIDHVDVLLFNHNASALNIKSFHSDSLQNPKDWQRSYFVATQFPYYYVKLLTKKINKGSKIGWMLSELIQRPMVNQVGFSDYIGNKFTNACIMKSFSLAGQGTFFGVHPDGGTALDPELKAKNIVHLIDTYNHSNLNGNILDSQGNILNMF